MKKILIIIAGIVLVIILIIGVIVGVLAIRFFIIGDIMRPGVIGLIKVSASDSQIKFSGDFILASAQAYKNYSYRIEGGVMYIKIYGVYVSALHKYGQFDITMNGDFSTITAIYLEDSKEKKIIWEK